MQAFRIEMRIMSTMRREWILYYQPWFTKLKYGLFVSVRVHWTEGEICSKTFRNDNLHKEQDKSWWLWNSLSL